MPTICRFYGLSIKMYFRQSEHEPPHIHVSYGSSKCEINLLNCSIMKGKLPPRAAGMAIEWTIKNQNELLEIWNTQEFRELPPLE